MVVLLILMDSLILGANVYHGVLFFGRCLFQHEHLLFTILSLVTGPSSVSFPPGVAGHGSSASLSHLNIRATPSRPCIMVTSLD